MNMFRRYVLFGISHVFAASLYSISASAEPNIDANISIKAAPAPHDAREAPRVHIRTASEMRTSRAKKDIKGVTEEIRQRGYRTVKDMGVSPLSIDNLRPQFLLLSDVEKHVSFPLAKFTNKIGVYKLMKLEGVIAMFPDKKAGKWTHIKRYYSLPDKSTLMLSEYDYVADKVHSAFAEELINSDVNGNPALLMTTKSELGFFTRLTWFNDRKIYSLHVTGRPAGVGKKNELTVLAEGIQNRI